MKAAGDPRGYYRILGVAPAASAEELRLAFRERAKRYHPDHGGAEADGERFRRLREAYDILRDPRRRMQYDAMGLEAQPENGAAGPDGSGRGGRTGRSTSPWRIGPIRLAQIAGGLAALLLLLLVIVLGLYSSARQQLEERDLLVAELYERLDRATADQAEVRARYRDASFRRLEEMVEAAGGRLEGSGAFVFASELAFKGDQAELDGPLRGTLDAAVVDLAAHIGEIPPDRDWLIVIEGQARRAALPGGVAVDAWELTLLRLASVIDHLVAQGLPVERLAVRFAGGMAPSDIRRTDSGIVEVKLLCCLR